mmetsp:Transcript_17463/g.15393  ORF Transcript_17463/g.15393 Transcript_17463/m.15393 type:complete len:91 (+) Transcript_17463:336-608(+)
MKTIEIPIKKMLDPSKHRARPGAMRFMIQAHCMPRAAINGKSSVLRSKKSAAALTGMRNGNSKNLSSKSSKFSTKCARPAPSIIKESEKT